MVSAHPESLGPWRACSVLTAQGSEFSKYSALAFSVGRMRQNEWEGGRLDSGWEVVWEPGGSRPHVAQVPSFSASLCVLRVSYLELSESAYIGPHSSLMYVPLLGEEVQRLGLKVCSGDTALPIKFF